MKYVAIKTPPTRQGDWEDQPPIAAANTVYEKDEEPQKTGLLDAEGTPLYRVNSRCRMGYLP